MEDDRLSQRNRLDRWTTEEANEFRENYEIYRSNIGELLDLNRRWIELASDRDNYYDGFLTLASGDINYSIQVGGRQLFDDGDRLSLWIGYASIQDLYIGSHALMDRLGLYFDDLGSRESHENTMSFQELREQTKYDFDVLEAVQTKSLPSGTPAPVPFNWRNQTGVSGRPIPAPVGPSEISILDVEPSIEPELHQTFVNLWVRLNDLNSVVTPALTRMYELYWANKQAATPQSIQLILDDDTYGDLVTRITQTSRSNLLLDAERTGPDGVRHQTSNNSYRIQHTNYIE